MKSSYPRCFRNVPSTFLQFLPPARWDRTLALFMVQVYRGLGDGPMAQLQDGLLDLTVGSRARAASSHSCLSLGQSHFSSKEQTKRQWSKTPEGVPVPRLSVYRDEGWGQPGAHRRVRCCLLAPLPVLSCLHSSFCHLWGPVASP